MLIFNYLAESELLVKETESAVPVGVRDDELLPLFVLLHMCQQMMQFSLVFQIGLSF